MIGEVINELKKYILGKKNTEKVEISVLKLNRIIKTLEQESCDDVLNKIRAELIQSIQNGTLKIENGNEKLFCIIDKYKIERGE